MIPRESIEEILGVPIQEINDSSTDPSDASIDLGALEELQKELAGAQEQLSKYAPRHLLKAKCLFTKTSQT